MLDSSSSPSSSSSSFKSSLGASPSFNKLYGQEYELSNRILEDTEQYNVKRNNNNSYNNNSKLDNSYNNRVIAPTMMRRLLLGFSVVAVMYLLFNSYNK